MSDASGEYFTSHEQLRAENQELRRSLLEKAEMSRQFVALRAENDRLRNGQPQSLRHSKMRGQGR